MIKGGCSTHNLPASTCRKPGSKLRVSSFDITNLCAVTLELTVSYGALAPAACPFPPPTPHPNRLNAEHGILQGTRPICSGGVLLVSNQQEAIPLTGRLEPSQDLDIASFRTHDIVLTRRVSVR